MTARDAGRHNSTGEAALNERQEQVRDDLSEIARFDAVEAQSSGRRAVSTTKIAFQRQMPQWSRRSSGNV